jgi:hypothetical protein
LFDKNQANEIGELIFIERMRALDKNQLSDFIRLFLSSASQT